MTYYFVRSDGTVYQSDKLEGQDSRHTATSWLQGLTVSYLTAILPQNTNAKEQLK